MSISGEENPFEKMFSMDNEVNRSFEDHANSVALIANTNKLDIVLLKSVFADILNRLCSVEEELKHLKAKDAKKKKSSSSSRPRDATSSNSGRDTISSGSLKGSSSFRVTSSTRDRDTTSSTKMTRAKSMSNLADMSLSDTHRSLTRTNSGGKDMHKPLTRTSSAGKDTHKPLTRTASAGKDEQPRQRRISRATSEKDRSRSTAPCSSAKKKFWREEENNISSKQLSNETIKESEDEGKEKPKIILAKKKSIARKPSRPMSMIFSDDSSQKTVKDDMVKFNTRGRTLTLYPPSGYQEDILDGSAPELKLKLGWVYGYRGMDCRDNLHYIRSGELVYNMAGVIILHDVEAGVQRHYTQHTDDVKCIAVHPNKRLIASGQVAGHGEDRRPHVQVWDVTTLNMLISFGNGIFERGLCALEFSNVEDGKYLIAFDESNDHVIYVYDWEKGTKLTETKASKEHLFGARWNPKSDFSFVSYGKSHLMFWSLSFEDRGVGLTKKAAIYEKISKPKYVQCVAYTSDGDLVSGDSTGNILLFSNENNKNRVTGSALSAHKGGVFCLCFIASKDTLLSTGKDGQFSLWNTALDKLADFSKIPDQYGPARVVLHNSDNDNFFIGTARNCILQYHSDLAGWDELVFGHFDEMWGLAAHTKKYLFATCAHEQLVCIWNCETKKPVWSYYVEDKAQCAEFHPDSDYLLVGTRTGTIYFLNYTTKEEEIVIELTREMINDIKISPDGKGFAVGCRDKNIYLYTWPDDVTAIKKPKVLQGHTSKVTHIDWSSDSEYLQSNSSDCELLYWSAEAALQILNPSELRDVNWASWSCPYGFPAMGVWPEGETDINACSRSYDGKLIATGDTSGEVKVFRYPCARHRSEYSVGVGHSSHVTCVSFLANDYGLVSVGGKDCSVMHWNLESNQ